MWILLNRMQHSVTCLSQCLASNSQIRAELLVHVYRRFRMKLCRTVSKNNALLPQRPPRDVYFYILRLFVFFSAQTLQMYPYVVVADDPSTNALITSSTFSLEFITITLSLIKWKMMPNARNRGLASSFRRVECGKLKLHLLRLVPDLL